MVEPRKKKKIGIPIFRLQHIKSEILNFSIGWTSPWWRKEHDITLIEEGQLASHENKTITNFIVYLCCRLDTCTSKV